MNGSARNPPTLRASRIGNSRLVYSADCNSCAGDGATPGWPPEASSWRKVRGAGVRARKRVRSSGVAPNVLTALGSGMALLLREEKGSGGG